MFQKISGLRPIHLSFAFTLSLGSISSTLTCGILLSLMSGISFLSILGKFALPRVLLATLCSASKESTTSGSRLEIPLTKCLGRAYCLLSREC